MRVLAKLLDVEHDIYGDEKKKLLRLKFSSGNSLYPVTLFQGSQKEADFDARAKDIESKKGKVLDTDIETQLYRGEVQYQLTFNNDFKEVKEVVHVTDKAASAQNKAAANS